MAHEQMKQVVGYVRVSVDNDEKISPEIQAEAITAYCASKGWELVETFVERGKSAGEGKKRPRLDAARKLIRNGQATGLVVSKIDRCSRSVTDFGNLLSELRDREADFVSVSEQFDTSTAIGRAMLQITMVFAELERARASERITDWHRHRTRRGEVPPKLPFGYCRAHDGITIDPDAGQLVRDGVALFLETGRLVDVERLWAEHGVVKRGSTIRQTLSSPTLAGVRRVDGTRDPKGRRRVGQAPADEMYVPGDWEALISLDDHRRVLDALSGRAIGRPPAPPKLLTAIATCGVDGHTLGAWNRSNGRPPGYRCTKPSCGLSIGQHDLNKHVEDRLLAYVTPEMWKRIPAGRPAQPAVDTLALERKLTELAEDWAMERITTAERDAARAVLIDRAMKAEQTIEHELPDVRDLHGAWPDLSTEAKRLVISAFVDHVKVRRGRSGPDRDGSKLEERVKIRWR